MIAPGCRFVAVTVSGKAAWPAVTEPGDRFVITGSGWIVNVIPFDEMLSIVRTVRTAVPGVESKPAGTLTIRLLALVKVVGRTVGTLPAVQTTTILLI